MFYDIAGGFEEVDSCGEVKGIRKAGQAESKDKEIQESEKTFFPCSKDITQHKGKWLQKNTNKSTPVNFIVQHGDAVMHWQMISVVYIWILLQRNIV